jgi:hypothetical protein
MADRAADGTGALKRSGRFTYRDYKTWPAEERWELIYADNAEHVVQPDAFVVCDEQKLADNGVVGVREYWIINPDTFELFAYTLQDGRFPLPAVAELREGFTAVVFPHLTVRVRPADL